MSVVLQTGVMYYRESQSDDWHPLILKVDTDLSALIEDYSQRAWELGEYCRYSSAIYRCTTAITTPEVWDSTHWQETTIGDELKALNDEIIISDTQPTEQNNKLWVKETSSVDGVSIPTMGDIDDIEDEISALETLIDTGVSDVTITDLSTVISNVYSVIGYGTVGSITARIDGLGRCMIDFQFFANSAISTGYVNLSSYLARLPASAQLHAAINTSSGKTGWVQLTTTGLLYIRCQESTDSTFCGQLVY